MTQLPVEQLTTLQQTIVNTVGKYPGQFTRSSLSKMLVGAKSWKDKSYSEYGLYPGYGRKEMDYQIEILIQQAFLRLDGQKRLEKRHPIPFKSEDI
jgi:hypothetical protein